MNVFRKVPNIAFISFFLLWSMYFGILWARAIQVDETGWYAAYLPHWGDGAAHLSYMASFAYKSLFPSMHPLFLFQPFSYSFAADLIGGLLTRVGLPLWYAYNLWGFILSLAFLFALWHFFWIITKSSMKTFMAATLFLTSGGLGWKYLILDRLGITSPPDISYFPVLYTQRENAGLFWLNTIVGELIPQRAFLLAIPLAVFMLITWYRTFITRQTQSTLRLILSGIVFGCMPIVHPHTTMVLALTLVWWGGYAFLEHHPHTFSRLVSIGIPAGVIGVIITTQFITPAVSHGFFRFSPGWMAGTKNINWFLFWIDNWGLFLPLAAIGTWLTKDKFERQVLYPFWIWFGLANLFLFQPYDWDNAKILTWVYLVFCIPVTNMVVELWKNKGINRGLAVISFVVITLAGGLDAVRMLDTQTYRLQLVNHDQLELAQTVKTITSPNAIFLTSTTHRHWIPVLTGRQILCGYLGWMWTYGIDADARVRDIKAMYAGNDQAVELLSAYGINYVVIGPEEHQEFTVNTTFFASRYPVLTQTADTTVYQIAPR